MEGGDLSIKSHFLFYITNTIAPIILGIAIYLIIKPNAYISYIIYKYLPFQLSISLSPRNIITIFIHNYLCDILWAYAFMMTLCFTSAYQCTLRFHTVIACIIFELFIEILQYFHIISGTFDFMDIIWEILANLLALAIWKYNKKKKPTKGGINTYEKEMY